MNEKSKMELIKDFIETCPLLKKGQVKVDYLNSKSYSYSIEEQPTTNILQKFTDGGCRKLISVDFNIKAPYTLLETIKNSKFCDEFIKWVEEQNNKENLPEIEGAEELICNRGTIIRTSETSAVYIIPIKFIYVEEF